METSNNSDYHPFIGALYKDVSLGVKVTQVLEDSPAAKAGIAVNDIIVAVDRIKASEKSLQQLAEHLPENTTVDCHYFKDDQLLNHPLTITDSPNSGIRITEHNSTLSEQWRKIIN